MELSCATQEIRAIAESRLFVPTEVGLVFCETRLNGVPAAESERTDLCVQVTAGRTYLVRRAATGKIENSASAE